MVGSFNPSYGLHALRAEVWYTRFRRKNSFNPSYGLHALRAPRSTKFLGETIVVSIPHMGCMPYGPLSISDNHTDVWVSIPHMGCMPYGPQVDPAPDQPEWCFNPSYGLHALRAATSLQALAGTAVVSIPHMGCMPYGQA